ncbi:MAG: hypothetical protein FP826_05640 [Sphingomonadales bacterium]|nr:hypothetical protein [Sphingomonadales bacterium]
MTRTLDLLYGAALAAIAAPVVAHGSEAPGTAAPHDRASAGLVHQASAGPAQNGTRIDRSHGDGFLPPHGTVVLTRELRKTLSDGKQFVTRRRYAIRFVSEGEGYVVMGDLVGSEVDGPAELADLAEIERTRAEAGPFPLHLDRAGMSTAQAGRDDPRAAAQTMQAASAYLAQSALAGADRTAALALAARLQAPARSADGNWPADLFRPARGERAETRELALSGGASGKVTTTISANNGPSGLLERLQRRIVTDFGGSSRLSVETWTLAASR